MKKELQERIYQTDNELKLTVKAQQKEVLVDEDCCTCINIILKNDGQIMTSFLGAHNPEIVKQLERAQKTYFKEIKKTLKVKYKEAESCESGSECTTEKHCGCGGHAHNEKASSECGHDNHNCENDKHDNDKCDDKNIKYNDCKCKDNDKKNAKKEKCCSEDQHSEKKSTKKTNESGTNSSKTNSSKKKSTNKSTK